MFAIRDDRDYVTQDDFMKGARKQQEVRSFIFPVLPHYTDESSLQAKKHESSSEYKAV